MGMGILYKNHRRGFRVARSTLPGNAKASQRGTGNGYGLHAFLYSYQTTLLLMLKLGVDRQVKTTNNMDTNGCYHYQVEFMYKDKTYTCEFYSTAEINENSDKLVAWGIADDAIMAKLQTIPNRVDGVHPYAIKIIGELGTLVVKE